MRAALPWLLLCMAGCTTAANAPSATGMNTPAPALTANPPISADNNGLREKLDEAATAAVTCVLHQASRLAGEAESPEHIALAAMVACGRQEQALIDVAELAYGRERSLAQVHLIQEQTRKGVFALLATLRSRARQQEPPKPGTRRGTDI